MSLSFISNMRRLWKNIDDVFIPRLKTLFPVHIVPILFTDEKYFWEGLIYLRKHLNKYNNNQFEQINLSLEMVIVVRNLCEFLDDEIDVLITYPDMCKVLLERLNHIINLNNNWKIVLYNYDLNPHDPKFREFRRTDIERFDDTYRFLLRITKILRDVAIPSLEDIFDKIESSTEKDTRE